MDGSQFLAFRELVIAGSLVQWRSPGADAMVFAIGGLMVSVGSILSRTALSVLALTVFHCQQTEQSLPEPPRAPDMRLDADVVAAIEKARADVDNNATDTAAWLRLGMTFAANELPQQAADSYEAALILRPTDARAWYGLGIACAHMGDLDRAIEALHRAGDADSSYAPITWRRGFWRLETGDLDGAEQDFRHALILEQDAVAARTGLARVAMQRGQHQTAAELLEQLIRQYPREPYFHQLLGKTYLVLGRVKKAQMAIRHGSGRPMPPFSDPWQHESDQYATGFAGERDRALTAFAKDDLDDAILRLDKLLRERPGDGSLSYALGVAYMKADKPRRAAKALAAGVALNPGHNLLQGALSDAYLQSGELERALEHARIAAELNPALITYSRQARVLEALGRRQEALQIAVRAVTMEPNNVEMLHWLGRLQAESDAWGEAAATYRRLTVLGPLEPTFWVGLSRARLRLGEIHEADDALREAERLAPHGWPPLSALRSELRHTQSHGND